MRLSSLTLWAGIAVAIWAVAFDRSSLAAEANSFSAGTRDVLVAQNNPAVRTDNRCPNIVGDWQSWASLLFGEADTTIKSDGTMVHRSGMTGTWKCQGDKILMSWNGATPDVFTLKGNELINANGGVGFSRTEAQARAQAQTQAAASPASTPGKPSPASAKCWCGPPGQICCSSPLGDSCEPITTPAARAMCPQPGQKAQPQPPAQTKPQPAPLETPARSAATSIDEAGFYARAALYGTEPVNFGPDSDPSSDIDVCANGNGERAIAACTRVINDRDKWGNDLGLVGLVERGQLYGVQGRYDLAIQDFDRAIQQAPDEGIYYDWRGLTHGMRGDYDRAIRDFTQAIQFLPDFAAAYYGRGQTYVGKQAYDLALKDFAQAIALNPQYTLAYDKRAYVYVAKRDYGHAIADYTQAIRLSPDYAAAYNRRGTAYAMQGDYNHALSDYSAAIKLQPDSADFHYSRAELAALRGHSDQVIADLDAAIGLAPQRAEFYLLRGNAWIGKGDEDRAQRDFDQAIALDPKNEADVAAFAWSLKGQIKYVRGDPTTAAQDYNEAVRLAPRSAPFYVGRGMTWDARGDHTRAIRDYTQALTLEAGSKAARLSRGLAYFALGEFGPAAKDFAALKDDAADLHGALWFYLAQARTGSTESRSDLARAVAHSKPDVWPSPIFQMFLGQRDIRAVEAAAKTPHQRCEAQFYAGEWYLLHGQGAHPAAMQALSTAAKSCARTSIEYQTAVEELRRVSSSRQEGAVIRP